MSSRRFVPGPVEIGLSLLVAAAGLTAGWLYPWWREHVVVVCPLLEITGVPCPTCGGTRAIAALARGAWREALSWNPGVAVAGMGALLWLPLGTLLLAVPSWRPALPRRLGAGSRWALALLLAADWVYLAIWWG